jgi:hypothetical protein
MGCFWALIILVVLGAASEIGILLFMFWLLSWTDPNHS